MTEVLSSVCILVVEDEFIIAEVMMDELARSGFSQCHHADSIVTALAAAREGDWAGALLDIRLRGELVFPVAQVLHERSIPFAFCSGDADAGALPSPFETAPVLPKPWVGGQLRDLADTLFRSSTA